MWISRQGRRLLGAAQSGAAHPGPILPTSQLFSSSVHPQDVSTSPTTSPSYETKPTKSSSGKPVRREISEVLDEINALEGSSAAVRRLWGLKHIPQKIVRANIPEVLKCISNLLELCPHNSPSDMTLLLFNIGKTAQHAAPLREALNTEPYRATLQAAFDSCAKNPSLYTTSMQVSQIASAQYTILLSCPLFWSTVKEEHAEQWDPQAASNIVYAYGKLSGRGAAPPADPDMVQFLRNTVASHSEQFLPHQLSICAWSLAKQQIPFGSAYDAIRKGVFRTSPDMEPRAVANMLWAHATLGTQLGDLQEPLEAALHRSAPDLNHQDISNILWSYAVLNMQVGSLQMPLEDSILRLHGKMNAHNVANIVWAYASLGIPIGNVQSAIEETVLRVSKNMNAASIAKGVWGYATMGLELGTLQSPMENAIATVHDSIDAQAVAQILWGLAKLGVSSDQVRDHLLNAVLANKGALSAEQKSDISAGLQFIQSQSGGSDLLSKATAAVS